MNKTIRIISLSLLVIVLIIFVKNGIQKRDIDREGSGDTNMTTQESVIAELVSTDSAEIKKLETGTGIPYDSVEVDGQKIIGNLKPKIGFLHGFKYEELKNYDKTLELISALEPGFWRLGFGDDIYRFIAEANLVKKYNTQIMFVIQDAIHMKYGFDIKISDLCPNGKSNCFKTFDEFKSAWSSVTQETVKRITSQNLPVTYIEIFGEPINTGFGKMNSGTGISGISAEQLLELYKISHNIIRSEMPNVKIGGPGWIGYGKELLTAFLDFIVKENLSLNFLSWHEFGHPEDVPSHVAEMRKAMRERPALCKVACPEIAITEFMSERHLVPGEILTWLFYLEKAEVDQAHKACWDVEGETWDTCWAGFNGVLLEDNVTPQHGYWAYLAYATLTHDRLSVKEGQYTVALADKNDEKKELQVLVARKGLQDNAKNISVIVQNYPYDFNEVKVKIWKIPSNGNKAFALPLPIILELDAIEVVDKKITLPIANFEEGSAYLVTFSGV